MKIYLGQYERDDFYDEYPELEKEVMLHVLLNAKRKDALFAVPSFAKFVTEKFVEIYPEIILETGTLVRSESSLRCDLARWGLRWDDNKNRPYFEGHEREDVVTARLKFIDYFISNQSLYYTSTLEPAFWKAPIKQEDSSGRCKKIRIILAHDESTFKSGEI